MRNPLNHRFSRELRNNFGKYCGMFAMIAVTIALLAGFLTAASSIERLFNAMPETYHIEDGRFTADAPLNDGQWQVAEDQNLSLYQMFSRDVDFDIPDAGKTATMRLSANRDTVNTVALAQGSLPDSSGEIAINRNFASHYGLQVGSDITLAGRVFTICGIVTLPDYTAQFENNSDFVMDTLSFCTAVVTNDDFDSFSDRSTAYTYSFVFNDADLSLAQRTEAESDIAAALAESGVRLSSMIDSESNQGIQYAGEDVRHDQVMFEVFLLLLLVIMAFVFVVLSSSTIEEESAVIGTLLASGYRKGELLRHYLFMPFLIGLAAAVVGNAVGYTLLSQPMCDLYYNSYSLPPYEFTFSWRIFALTTIAPLVLLWGITFIGLARKLSCAPLQFLRHEVQHVSKRSGVRLPVRWSYVSRFRFRVFVRNLPHFATMFCGILLSSLILLFGLAMMPVVNNYANSLASSLPAQHIYMMKAPLPLDDETNDAKAIDQAEKLVVFSLEVPHKIGDENETVSVYGIQDDSRYYDISLSDDEVVVGAGLEQKCDAHVGSIVRMYNKYDDVWHEMRVSSVYGELTDTNIYMSAQALNDLAGNDDGYFNAYLSDEELDLDSRYVTNEITPSTMEKVMNQMQDSMGDMVGLMQVLAVFIFFVVMYLLTKTVIERNSRQISYLKVFGYRDEEIRKLYVRTITLVVLISLIVSLPIVIVFMNFFCELMFMGYSGNFPLVFPSYLLAVELALGFITYLVVALLHMRRIKRVPLSLALKVQE